MRPCESTSKGVLDRGSSETIGLLLGCRRSKLLSNPSYHSQQSSLRYLTLHETATKGRGQTVGLLVSSPLLRLHPVRSKRVLQVLHEHDVSLKPANGFNYHTPMEVAAAKDHFGAIKHFLSVSVEPSSYS